MSAVSAQTEFPVTTLRMVVSGQNNLVSFYDKPLGRHQEVTEEADKLSASDYAKITKAAGEAGVERILICGNEPLLRKDTSSVIKSICSAKKIQDIRLLTNGVFLKDFADSLRRNGLKHVEIALDSLNFMVYQKITRKDSLYRVLDGLQKIQRVQYPNIVLNVFLLRGVNDRELIDFAMKTKEESIHIRFVEYRPLKKETTLTRQLYMPTIEAMRKIQDFQKLIPVEDEDGETYAFKEAKGRVSFVADGGTYYGYNEPKLTLNSQGILKAEHSGSRGHNLLKELEKDNAEERLQRLFQKLMVPESVKPQTPTPGKTTRSKSRQARA